MSKSQKAKGTDELLRKLKSDEDLTSDASQNLNEHISATSEQKKSCY
jgi:hypothetical protein